ncbi:hypothetical protein [Sinorhizobium psoraleae]|uniref:Thymidine phosphorylase n=1 Tax=Sinorhizobium psoraleae TaxID=520838 RepID=A0ABT4K9L2_9HYPH|nr:hypothetical protein [Sinorhizobium psoraleae]MCZ4088607.1 hypothetical protein [Sinorhizobium psoraleae]
MTSPEGVGGGVMVGHGALGEDVIFPGMAERGATIGTKAMMDAMSGAGMPSQKFLCALFGAAAILEIIHPDADVAEEYGPYGKVTSAFVAGRAAVRTAGLPEKLHVRITGKEIETAKLIGDLGLILKGYRRADGHRHHGTRRDHFRFRGRDLRGGAGPVNPPLGHICGDAVIALMCLLEDGSTEQRVASSLRERRLGFSFDPETAMVAMNIVARKATQICNGPVTDALIMSSTPMVTKALYARAARSYDDLEAGKTVGEIVRAMDEERQLLVEQRGSDFLTKAKGKTIKVHFTKISKGARRSSKMAARWLAFDPALDAEVTVGDETIHMEGIINTVIPEVAQGVGKKRAPFLTALAPIASELLLAGNVIMNVTVPAVVAAAMGKMSASDAASEAQAAGLISAGIPGTKAKAEAAARVAIDTMGL